MKGLIKCHKPARPDGKHDIRLLLASTNTPTKPASTLFQFAIAHILNYTKAILNRISEIRERFPNGLPETAINIGCNVKKLYPSIDSEMGLAAVKKWLQRFPNPDGLPLQFIMDLGQICVEENACEFFDRFFVQIVGQLQVLHMPVTLQIALWENWTRRFLQNWTVQESRIQVGPCNFAGAFLRDS